MPSVFLFKMELTLFHDHPVTLTVQGSESDTSEETLASALDWEKRCMVFMSPSTPSEVSRWAPSCFPAPIYCELLVLNRLTYLRLVRNGTLLDRCTLFVLSAQRCACCPKHTADRRTVSLSHSDSSVLRQQPAAHFRGRPLCGVTASETASCSRVMSASPAGAQHERRLLFSQLCLVGEPRAESSTILQFSIKLSYLPKGERLPLLLKLDTLHILTFKFSQVSAAKTFFFLVWSGRLDYTKKVSPFCSSLHLWAWRINDYYYQGKLCFCVRKINNPKERWLQIHTGWFRNCVFLSLKKIYSFSSNTFLWHVGLFELIPS